MANGLDFDAMHAAALQVVLPGTRGSFRRRVIDALRSLVPCSAGFFFLGTDDARAYEDASRLVNGVPIPFKAQPGTRLSKAFGFEAKSVVTTPRRAFVASELYPDSERVNLPFYSEHSVGHGYTQALLLFLHEGGVLFGLAGLERRADEPAFTATDAAAFERLAPFVIAGARAQIQYDELTREAASLRALAKVSGTLFVVDRDKKRVVWAADREHGIEWDQDVEPIAEQIVIAAENFLASKARGDALPTPPRLPTGTVVGAAKLDGDPVFGNARCAVVRVEASQRENQAAMEGLSKREREIARLLVAGYSGVNVAAISGLSENTVRTYVRRLYGKLSVSNRADLVRRLVAPEPGSQRSAPSSLPATPDSSLIEGDDTLD